MKNRVKKTGLVLFMSFVFTFLLLPLSFAKNIGETPSEQNQNLSSIEPGSEFRGMWITRFEWPSTDPEKCKQNIINVMKDLAEGNFNAAVFQIRGAAEVLYPSEIEPWSPLIGGKDPGFDPLELAIKEAHKYGIQFHAYINPIPLVLWRKGTPPPHSTPEHLFYLHGPDSPEPWVCMDENGNIMNAGKAGYYYLSPGIPEVHSYIRKVIMDVVRRYDVDGIHLDRIRYPGPQYSHDPISKRRFYGRGNPNKKEWADWQREQLDKLINDLYAEIMAEKPHIILSCAAWGIYNRYHIPGYYHFSSGYHDYYQDTWNWIRIGAMDVLMPMIYWDIPDPKPNYDELLYDFVKGIGAEHLIGGQRMYGDRWGVEENINEIKVTRKLKALGTVIFSYGSAKRKGAFQRLKETVYQTKVPVPELKWKTQPEYGIILGTVTDENGKPLVDAWVSLRPESKDSQYKNARIYRHKWTSSADGRFAFLKVPPEPVKLIVEYDGAPKKELSGIEVAPGEVKKIIVAVDGSSKAREQVFFHIFEPEDGSKTTREVVHLLGRTLPENKILIQDKEVPVYATGAFAMDNIPLKPGENKIKISAVSPDGTTTTTRYLTIIRTEPAPKAKPTGVSIIEPSADLSLMPGDVLEIRVKGPAGLKGFARCWNGKLKVALTEVRNEQNEPTGEYCATYRIPAGFSAEPSPVYVVLKKKGGFLGLEKKTLKATSKATVEVWDETRVRIGEVTEDGTGITFGTHYVRLGGPYLGEVPKGTRMEIIGKQGRTYKVRLSKSLSGWVSARNIKMLPQGTPPPHAFFTYCIIDGDDKYDKLWIPLKENVAYAIIPETEPQNCLYVDFFNTHYATTWFSHKSGAKVIGDVTGEQIEDGWYRLTVPLKCKQIWGYWTEKDARGLTIFIKRPPKIDYSAESPVKGLVFALEAGHGGSSTGAVGLMGTLEKTVNLNAVGYLRKALESRGAKVVLMRDGDSTPTLAQRVQIAIEGNADFIISIHANAAGTNRGFTRVSGTSTYYKYKHCALPAKLIYDELLKLGWGEFGAVGNFNYYPLRNTRIPAVLVEQAFMTHPYDEARLLDPEYQQQQAEAIVTGIEKFLRLIKE